LVFVDFEEPYIQPLKANAWTITVLGPSPAYQWYKGPVGDFGASTPLVDGGPPDVGVTSGANGPTLTVTANQLNNTGIATVTPLDEPVLITGPSSAESGLFLPQQAGNYAIIGGAFVSQAQIDAAVGAGDINDPNTWDDPNSISFFSRGGSLAVGTAGFQIGFTVEFTPVWVAVTNDCNQIIAGADDIVSLPPEVEAEFGEYTFQVTELYPRELSAEFTIGIKDMGVREISSEYAMQLNSLDPNRFWGFRESSSEYSFVSPSVAFGGEIPNQPAVSGDESSRTVNWTTGPAELNNGLPEAALSGVYFKVYRNLSSAPTVDPMYLIADFIGPSEYTDNDVLPAGEYFYIVTLVDNNNNESPASVDESIVIP
jgi:hypothetical protein